MLKNISNLGEVLSKKEQKYIVGGSFPAGTCPEGPPYFCGITPNCGCVCADDDVDVSCYDE